MALRKHKSNYEAQLNIPTSAKDELTWWIENVDKAFNPISHGDPTIELRTDTSKKGGARILTVTLPKACGLFWKSRKHKPCSLLKHFISKLI